jgi:acyl-CoA thioesterase
MTPADLSLVRRMLRRDRFAAAQGIALVELREGYARARMRLGPGHMNGVGVAQGGAVFTLADFAFAAASNSHGTIAVGLDTSMTFARAGTGRALVAEAREVIVTRRLSVCEVRVTGDGGELVALFRGTAFRKEEPVASLFSRAARPAAARPAAARPARGAGPPRRAGGRLSGGRRGARGSGARTARR